MSMFRETIVPPSGVVSKKFKILEDKLVRAAWNSTSFVPDYQLSATMSEITSEDFNKALGELCASEESSLNEEVQPIEEPLSPSASSSSSLLSEQYGQQLFEAEDNNEIKVDPNLLQDEELFMSDGASRLNVLLGAAGVANFNFPCDEENSDELVTIRRFP